MTYSAILDGDGWSLIGWRRNDWELARTPAASKVSYPDVGAVGAVVPGSVTGALQSSGVIDDPSVGLQSRSAEWVEHRDWEFRRSIGEEMHDRVVSGERLLLECDALDFSGAVLLGKREVGRFKGSFVPYSFDLTEPYLDGERELRIIFTGAPDGLAQNGWTSRIRDLKPRFNYGWDWTPRMVSAGIAGSVHLRTAGRDAPCLAPLVHGDYDAESDTGILHVRTRPAGDIPDGARVQVLLGGTVLAEEPVAEREIRAEVAVSRWDVAGRGEQALYGVSVRLLAADGNLLDEMTQRVGFRRISWHPTSQVPKGCDDWLCKVNDSPLFLAGVNWVPVRPQFADVTEADYRLRLERYRDIGVVMLRVWGGTGAEKSVFYDICDELGILVWQEFPLCSSGLDNLPPSDPEFIASLVPVAESYIERLAHHPCLAMWSGGNELNVVVEPGVPGPPLDASHPTLAALADVVARLDPGRRYVATSPSGPRFEAAIEEFGRGLHHDVHGPWEFEGTFAEWQEYWDRDDAVMRSEVGVAGASSMEVLERHGLLDVATVEELRQVWTHSSGWWLGQLDAWLADGGELGDLVDWVSASQRRQADMIRHAAQRSRDRFPACAGFLVWLGHDTFPCAVSLSLLDSNGDFKPAAHAFGEVFATHNDSTTVLGAACAPVLPARS